MFTQRCLIKKRFKYFVSLYRSWRNRGDAHDKQKRRKHNFLHNVINYDSYHMARNNLIKLHGNCRL